MSAQAAVLEHNVSAEAVTTYKLAALADAEAFAGLVRDALPELSQDDAWRYLVGTWVMTSALWAHARPPEAVLEALAADERLEKVHLDFPATLEDHLTTLALGLHARAAGWPGGVPCRPPACSLTVALGDRQHAHARSVSMRSRGWSPRGRRETRATPSARSAGRWRRRRS